MKKQFVIILIAALALSLTACNKKKLEQLESSNKQLSQVNQRQDSLLNDFMLYFNEFEENLDLIKEREAIISTNTENPEFQQDRKDKVLSDIQTINTLLVKNQTIIDSLTERLKGSQWRTKEFKRTIANLNKKLENKTSTIDQLKGDLETMNFAVASLNTKVDTLTKKSEKLAQLSETQSSKLNEQGELLAEQTEKIEFQTKSLNTGFYVTGTSKELKEADILTKEGGVIGLGSTTKLKDDFNSSAFTKIDITEIQVIPLATKKARLLTNHPADSYVIKGEEDKNVEGLEITDPERFWAASKYLVLVTN
ncbi:hypothetical protein N9933_01335 [bacterium]|nr:hypothetical protein [bacterium]